MFRELRGMFADIAAELGERAKVSKQELTGKDGGPLQTLLCLPDNGEDEEEGGDSQSSPTESH